MSFPFEPQQGLIVIHAELDPLEVPYCDWRWTREQRAQL